ncbi:gephyrin-like molybdotransferase Glp [Methanobrevibacter sp. DSM 116169]|uniref:molybdenum cofactor synthesis domain-containing protein n=1 Tax=Methanobrevibacter sp. DSM 116169 TaxID=3242727 RepID=UPI0038FD1B8A
MGTEFLKIKESDDAKKIIGNLFNKCYASKIEEIDVEDSYNRVLYEDIYSLIDFPSFDKALKDGFAIKAEDSYGTNEENPNTIDVIDFLEAGSTTNKVVEKGKCIEISTGAALPDGADGIAMVEFCYKHDDKVDILKSITPYQDVARKGSDMKEGDLLLKQKEVLNPGKIGVLLSQGFKTVDVYKKPVVGVISTGNELISQDEDLNYGKIYDVNSEMIKSSAISYGAIGKSLGIVKDDYDILKKKIESSLEEVDILICSGGTSAGLGDVLKHVLDEIGEVFIHGISVQPGKPTIAAIVNGKVVIGLPGNPVSAIVIFNVFVAPQIAKLSGYDINQNKKTIKAKLSKKIHSPLGRLQYQMVRLKNGLVEPIFKDSGAIFSLSEADGYVKVLKSIELVDVGEVVEVNLFN